MSQAELVLDYLQVLVWPAVVVLALSLFRAELRSVMRRLTGLEGFGVRAQIAQAVEQAQAVTGSKRKVRPSSQVPADAVTLTPTSYSEARGIAESFRDGKSVLVSFKKMADNDAKRMIDFMAGLVFQNRGTIERVAEKQFLITPSRRNS